MISYKGFGQKGTLTMWTRYDYVCTNCDALIEVTANVFHALDPDCICGNGHVINIGTAPAGATLKNAYKKSDKSVTKDTKPGLVKINTNPYN
jgi:hypothetical protein